MMEEVGDIFHATLGFSIGVLDVWTERRGMTSYRNPFQFLVGKGEFRKRGVFLGSERCDLTFTCDIFNRHLTK